MGRNYGTFKMYYSDKQRNDQLREKLDELTSTCKDFDSWGIEPLFITTRDNYSFSYAETGSTKYLEINNDYRGVEVTAEKFLKRGLTPQEREIIRLRVFNFKNGDEEIMTHFNYSELHCVIDSRGYWKRYTASRDPKLKMNRIHSSLDDFFEDEIEFKDVKRGADLTWEESLGVFLLIYSEAIKSYNKSFVRKFRYFRDGDEDPPTVFEIDRYLINK